MLAEVSVSVSQALLFTALKVVLKCLWPQIPYWMPAKRISRFESQTFLANGFPRDSICSDQI